MREKATWRLKEILGSFMNFTGEKSFKKHKNAHDLVGQLEVYVITSLLIISWCSASLWRFFGRFFRFFQNGFSPSDLPQRWMGNGKLPQNNGAPEPDGHPLINGWFKWMVPNLYMEKWWLNQPMNRKMCGSQIGSSLQGIRVKIWEQYHLQTHICESAYSRPALSRTCSVGKFRKNQIHLVPGKIQKKKMKTEI